MREGREREGKSDGGGDKLIFIKTERDRQIDRYIDIDKRGNRQQIYRQRKTY